MATSDNSDNSQADPSTVPVVAVFGLKVSSGKCVESQGSAVVVGPRHLLTAYHVVNGCETLRIRIPDLKKPGRYIFRDVTSVADDPAHDLALLTTRKKLDLPQATLVGNLSSDDLKELNQFHQEDLLPWQCYGFPAAVELEARKRKDVDVMTAKSVTYDSKSGFGGPTPYQLENILPTETSRSDKKSITGIKTLGTDLPHGESGGGMLAYLKKDDGTYEWFGLGLNRLGGDGAASSNVRLFDKSQKVFTSKSVKIKLHSKAELLKAFGLDLDSVLQRRSQRCCGRWERTWTQLDRVENIDDESRWLAFYVPPHYSKFVRPQRVSKGVELDPIDHPNIDKNTHSPPTASGEKPNDGWEQVPGKQEEERLANLVKPQHLVVFEGPGAGKTIFTKRLQAFFSSEAGQRLQSEKPLLVIRQASWENDWSTAFEKELICDAKDCAAYAKRLVDQAKKEGRLVWILDALDQLSDQTRDATLGNIRNFLLSDSGKKIRVIVTSRPGAVREQLGKFLQRDQQIAKGIDWNYARIEPFSVAQQYRYLYGPEKPGQQASGRQDPWSARQLDWEAIDRHRIVPPAINVADDESVIESIALKVSNYGDARIQQLMSNPAILAMIRSLAQDGDLPTFNRRADLYKVVSRRMIERALSKLSTGQTMDADRVDEILAALAFASMVTDPSSHEFRGDVVKRIRDLASKRLEERVQSKDWSVVDQMPGKTSRSFLLSSMESELRWSHKGVMEFYCGRFLFGNSDPKWCPDEEHKEWPVCRDRSVWEIAANPQWEEAFRFAIELGLSTEPISRNEEVLLASLGMLYEVPANGTGWERPTQLMFEAWSLLEDLPRCDWYDSIEPVPLKLGIKLIERFRRQFQEIKDDPNHLGHEVAQAMLRNFRLCPPEGNDDPQKLRFKIGDELADATIEAAFELNAYAVTNQEYELFDEAHKRERDFDKTVAGDDDLSRHPVLNVDWFSAWCFCQWLGVEYRLPNEKEWEFACRAGTDSKYNVGPVLTSKDANFGGQLGHTTSVGSYDPNKFELHDMHGNVWEWCANWYWNIFEESVQSTYRPGAGYSARVLRGGSWYGLPLDCRSACRDGFHPSTSYSRNVGFRVARAWSRKS
jgi:formylglycine-generating enzyme required for sulfatase activity